MFLWFSRDKSCEVKSDENDLDDDVADADASALWAKLLRKWEIGKFNKITSSPLIF